MRNSSAIENLASRITAWAEKWFPDSYLFALLALFIATLAALIAGVPLHAVTTAFGEGFWSLIPFTLQMAMVVISGYVLAASPPTQWLIRKLAEIPKSEKSAVAYVALFTIIASMFNWAFSLVFGGLYVRALAQRSDLRIDYRAAGAAAYLGLGATWALGLSSSAAQLQANAESIPKSLLAITGVIPFTETIFLPQSLILLGVITALSVTLAYVSAPNQDRSLTANDLKIDVRLEKEEAKAPTRPSEWLEHSPALTLMICALGFTYLASEFYAHSVLLTISNLNTYNLLFLLTGMLLNWRPRNFLHAVNKAVPSAGGILIQFPIYGSIAFILTKAANHEGLTLSHHLSQFFVSISTRHTYCAIMACYSAVLGFFIPSGGGKWLIEAPYLMHAANDLKVHLGWTVMVYNAAEALPNLINPFFMLALTGILGLRARDLMGYTITQLLFHAPVVIFLLWALGESLSYHAPILP